MGGGCWKKELSIWEWTVNISWVNQIRRARENCLLDVYQKILVGFVRLFGKSSIKYAGDYKFWLYQSGRIGKIKAIKNCKKLRKMNGFFAKVDHFFAKIGKN
jgi:hypothetical protein